jgi:ribosomal protein S18 acetylase RimI-like enzyme
MAKIRKHITFGRNVSPGSPNNPRYTQYVATVPLGDNKVEAVGQIEAYSPKIEPTVNMRSGPSTTAANWSNDQNQQFSMRFGPATDFPESAYGPEEPARELGDETGPRYKQGSMFQHSQGTTNMLAVHPDYQRMGIASSLVDMVEQDYGKMGDRVTPKSPWTITEVDPDTGEEIPRALGKSEEPAPDAGPASTMTHSSGLSPDSAALYRSRGINVDDKHVGTLSTGETREERDAWASSELAGTTMDLNWSGRVNAPDPQATNKYYRPSPAEKSPINTRRSNGQPGPSRRRSLNIIPSAIQPELPLSE